MAIGTRGGLGGLGMSYPARAGMPESQTVGFMPSWGDWEADWTKRKNEYSPMVRTTAQLVPGSTGFVAPDAAQWRNSIFDSMATRDLINAGVSQSDLPSALKTYQDAVGGADNYLSLRGTPYVSGSEGGGAHSVTWSALNPSPHDFEAERADALKRYEPVMRQQQAYDKMRGWGQENGVMSPDYTNPTFGRINGQMNGDPGIGQGGNPGAGVNSTANGVFSPGQSSVGVFGAPRRASNWGLF